MAVQGGTGAVGGEGGHFEAALHGAVANGDMSALETRLRGLCGPPAPFRELEMVFKPTVSATAGAFDPTSTPMVVRVRLDDDGVPLSWVVRWLGGHKRDAEEASVSRVLESTVGDNVRELLNDLGYRCDYQLLRSGTRYRGRGGIVATLSQIYAVDEEATADEPPYGDVEAGLLPPCQGFHLVEVLTVVRDEEKDLVGALDTLAEFQRMVQPIVSLEKVNHFMLSQQAGQ